MIIRMYLRTIKYDEQTVQVGLHTYIWSELDAAGFIISQTEVFIIPQAAIRKGGKYESSKLTIKFKSGRKIAVLPDMEGRKEFIADLKKISKQRGIKFTTTNSSR